MQNNAIDVLTRGVDIYELILQSQRLQIQKNGRQTHIGNTSLLCKYNNWEINKWMANTHWQHNDCYFKCFLYCNSKNVLTNELYSAPKSALSQGSLHKGTTPWCFSVLRNPELQQQRSCRPACQFAAWTNNGIPWSCRLGKLQALFARDSSHIALRSSKTAVTP